MSQGIHRAALGGIGSVPARALFADLIGFVLGALLPWYFLDEPEAKAILIPALIAVMGAWLLASRFSARVDSRASRIWLATFLGAYSVGLVLSAASGHETTVNVVYPYLFAVLCWRRPENLAPYTRGLLIGLVALCGLGWYRFVSGDGGLASEHLLGYWGIKYTEATRNSDALIPLTLTCFALSPISFGSRDRLIKIPLLCIAAPALVLTFSRASWLAALAFLFIAGGLNRKTALWAIGISAGASVIIGLALTIAPDLLGVTIDTESLVRRLQSIYEGGFDASNTERLRVLQYASILGATNPLGVGTGEFDCCLHELGFSDLQDLRHPENFFLHLYSEFGVLTGISIFAFLAVTAAQGLRAQTPAQRLAAAFLTSLIIWLQMNSEVASLFAWIILGLLASVCRASRTTSA